MKWLYRLDYKYGNYYIRRLMTIIVAGMAAVFVAQMMLPTVNVYGLLSLSRTQIVNNLQIWRLITFLFVPPGSANMFFLFIAMYFYWIMGTSLENTWGGFRFNMYYLIGWLGAIIAMFITGSASNTYLNLSLFLAFATLSPDTTFMLFFILPIKAKWMAAAYGVFTVLTVIQSFVVYSIPVGISALVTLLFSLLNYVLFFGRGLIDAVGNELRVRKNRRQWRNNNR